MLEPLRVEIYSEDGPEKMKDAMGRLGLLSPTRARRMARAMATTASSCPMTRLCSVSSIFTSLSLSSLDTCTQAPHMRRPCATSGLTAGRCEDDTLATSTELVNQSLIPLETV